MKDKMYKKNFIILIVLMVSHFNLYTQVKAPGQRGINNLSKPTSVTRGENITKEQFEEYTKKIEDGSTDENIAYQLGVYNKLFHESWYSDKAKFYFLIGASQNSPRCLYELATNLSLRDDDMTDVQSYDKLKELSDKNYKDAKVYYEKISQHTKEILELKRQGIIVDE